MARPIEFNREMGSEQDHLELLKKRIEQVEAELAEAKDRGNDVLAAEAEERLAEVKRQYSELELKDQESA